MAAVALLVPAAGAAADKLIPAAVLATTALRFAAGGYEWTAADEWRITAGVVGLVLCVLAIYAALAMLLEDVHHRTIVPLLRRDAGSSSIAGGLADQVRRVESEAGVREQL